MPGEFETYDVLGIPISIATLASARAKIEDWSKDEKGRFVCVREVPSLMAAIDDPDFLSLHKKSCHGDTRWHAAGNGR